MAYAKETICIQSGWKPKNGEPRVLPIYQSTTFKYESSEQMGRLFDLEESGYFYSRLANPTNDCVAQKICELEGGAAAMLTGSGQAANYYAVFNICEAGRPCRIIVHCIRRNLQSAGGYHEKNGRILYCRRPGCGLRDDLQGVPAQYQMCYGGISGKSCAGCVGF